MERHEKLIQKGNPDWSVAKEIRCYQSNVSEMLYKYKKMQRLKKENRDLARKKSNRQDRKQKAICALKIEHLKQN